MLPSVELLASAWSLELSGLQTELFQPAGRGGPVRGGAASQRDRQTGGRRYRHPRGCSRPHRTGATNPLFITKRMMRKSIDYAAHSV